MGMKIVWVFLLGWGQDARMGKDEEVGRRECPDDPEPLQLEGWRREEGGQ